MTDLPRIVVSDAVPDGFAYLMPANPDDLFAPDGRLISERVVRIDLTGTTGPRKEADR
jgi:hypothetical protein